MVDAAGVLDEQVQGFGGAVAEPGVATGEQGVPHDA